MSFEERGTQIAKKAGTGTYSLMTDRRQSLKLTLIIMRAKCETILFHIEI
jgi:hypothetical protein